MQKETIFEMNEVIARFMALEERHDEWRAPHPTLVFLYDNAWTPVPRLKYHSSWDWIIPVWIKFRKLELDNKYFSEWCNSLSWYLYSSDEPSRFAERLYYAIQWYNKYSNSYSNLC
jgi:hypothetical protein